MVEAVVGMFVLGALVGSFLSVVVSRLHAGKGFVAGRSACPHCGHQLAAWELIPLLSWIGLRGRCHQCHRRIPLQDPALELLAATLFALTYLAHPLVAPREILVYVLWLYVLSSLIVLAVYDLRHQLLPDKVLLPIMVPAAAILLGEALDAHSLQVALDPLLAALLFGGGFYLLAVVSKGRWMGGGDIKLAFVMGLLLGLQRETLAMFIAFDAAAIIGIILIATRVKSRKDHIPFGPFLILGTVVAFLYGSQILAWYLGYSRLNLL